LIREKIKSIDGICTIKTSVVFSTYKEMSQLPIDETAKKI